MVGWDHGPGDCTEVVRDTAIGMGQIKSFAETMQLDLSAWLSSIIGSVQLVWDFQIFELTNTVTAEFRDLLDGLSVATCPRIMIHCVRSRCIFTLIMSPNFLLLEASSESMARRYSGFVFIWDWTTTRLWMNWKSLLGLLGYTYLLCPHSVCISVSRSLCLSIFWEILRYEKICIIFKAVASKKPFPCYHFLLSPVSRSEIQNLKKFSVNNHISKPVYPFQSTSITETL